MLVRGITNGSCCTCVCSLLLYLGVYRLHGESEQNMHLMCFLKLHMLFDGTARSFYFYLKSIDLVSINMS